MHLGQELNVLFVERNRLQARVEQEREQRDRLQLLLNELEARLADDERMLSEINSLLGKEPQLCLQDQDLRLRGRRIADAAVRILREEKMHDEPVHYRDWYSLVRARGVLVAGKAPLNTFLTQINRCEEVERVGYRTGYYRLARIA